jgi:predicted enzyme related to lactoylglutathione lyase
MNAAHPEPSASHHSRLSTLMIDCATDRFEQSIDFWTRALGLAKPRRPSAGQRYITLGRVEGPLFVRLQKVDRNPGYHLDIASDSPAAEVERLEAAGAKLKYRIKRWWVLEDPSGNAFCVIRPESDAFPEGASRWADKP